MSIPVHEPVFPSSAGESWNIGRESGIDFSRTPRTCQLEQQAIQEGHSICVH